MKRHFVYTIISIIFLTLAVIFSADKGQTTQAIAIGMILLLMMSATIYFWQKREKKLKKEIIHITIGATLTVLTIILHFIDKFSIFVLVIGVCLFSYGSYNYYRRKMASK
jgi:ABC-type Mn2+/Zn2+ transport system permease subunit